MYLQGPTALDPKCWLQMLMRRSHTHTAFGLCLCFAVARSIHNGEACFTQTGCDCISGICVMGTCEGRWSLDAPVATFVGATPISTVRKGPLGHYMRRRRGLRCAFIYIYIISCLPGALNKVDMPNTRYFFITHLYACLQLCSPRTLYRSHSSSIVVFCLCAERTIRDGWISMTLLSTAVSRAG